VDSSILVQFNDNGLKIKIVRVGDICITEETINGRVLSGRIDTPDGYCGYRYDYRNGENLLNINPKVPINTAVSLINKHKNDKGFLAAELAFSCIARNDYNVVTLNKGNLNITKTTAAEYEQSERCYVQEIIDLSKLSSEDRFIENHRKRVYVIGDSVFEESQIPDDSDTKSKISILLDIFNKSPRSYKELIEIKNQIIEKYIVNDEETS
jgi:hypothetical protein